MFSSSNVYYLFAALVALVLSYVFQAFRQNLAFLNTGANLTQLLNLKLLWLGMFYNLFLPGGVGGDGYKVYLVHKYRKNGIKKNIGAMLVNRISGLVAIGIITVIMYYLSGLQMPYGNWAWIGIPVVYALYYFVLKFFFKSFLKIHAGLFLWSLAVQIMQFISALFILYAFHQTTDLFNYLFLFFVSSIATAVPITIGGIGMREMVFLVSAKTLALNIELCIALSLMSYIITAIISFGGLYWVFFPPFRREQVPVETSEKPVELSD